MITSSLQTQHKSHIIQLLCVASLYTITACTNAYSNTPHSPSRTPPYSVDRLTPAPHHNLIVTNTTTGDLNNDSINDIATVIALDGPGSGTFHYLNVFVTRQNKPHLLGTYPLGDRIRTETISISNTFPDSSHPNTQSTHSSSTHNSSPTNTHPDDPSLISVSVLTHSDGQPMSEIPTRRIVWKWKIINNKLVKIK